MIVVPSIFKAVLAKEQLGFQVAPGLWSGTSSKIAVLDNESPRTAYLVDADCAGRRMHTKIKEAGVADEVILNLPSRGGEKTVIEEYVPIGTYVQFQRDFDALAIKARLPMKIFRGRIDGNGLKNGAKRTK